MPFLCNPAQTMEFELLPQIISFSIIEKPVVLSSSPVPANKFVSFALAFSWHSSIRAFFLAG
jgi:hypothetical protein